MCAFVIQPFGCSIINKVEMSVISLQCFSADSVLALHCGCCMMSVFFGEKFVCSSKTQKYRHGSDVRYIRAFGISVASWQRVQHGGF